MVSDSESVCEGNKDSSQALSHICLRCLCQKVEDWLQEAGFLLDCHSIIQRGEYLSSLTNSLIMHNLCKVPFLPPVFSPVYSVLEGDCEASSFSVLPSGSSPVRLGSDGPCGLGGGPDRASLPAGVLHSKIVAVVEFSVVFGVATDYSTKMELH